jgi:hypothetical protein
MKKGRITINGTVFRGIGFGYYPMLIQGSRSVETQNVIVFLFLVFTVKVERYK